MAAPVVDAKSPQDQDASISALRSKKLGRRIQRFIVILVVFATIHFFLQRSPSLEVQTKVMPPVPRHIPAIHRRDTSIQSRNRTPRPTKVPMPASVASNSSWTFSAEELRKFRAAPGVHSAPECGTPGLPSTGLAAVLTATALCDHLFLYGFFPFQQDENKRPLPYHYYRGDSIEPIIQAENHYMDKEYQFYKRLHQRGVLKLHVGKCDKQ
ncbi:ST8SIA2 [Branchiostoma lanceolatum]|uniref:ST8SIA2 protein n=1 Tax=Branchiostoma lanceolatum TaxID=7740 RepID=A0A8K0EX63_BRALA|nr:ST8SIA2 [Branchiostoma lanceolatum]